jgi:hypothetical protein
MGAPIGGELGKYPLVNRAGNEEASALLEGTLGKFAEGFETVPFRRTRKLLDELSGAPASEGARHTPRQPGTPI